MKKTSSLMKETIGQRIIQFGESKFKSRAEFARAMGMSYENLYQYLRNRVKPGPEFISRLVDLDCNINWLFAGEEKSKNLKVFFSEQEKVVNKYNYKVMDTIPSSISEIGKSDSWQRSEDFDFDPDIHFFVVVDYEFGNSMYPFARKGDKFLCSYEDKVTNGDIVVAKWNEEKDLKFYFEIPNQKEKVFLTAVNPTVLPIIVDKNGSEFYKVVAIRKK